MFDFLLRRHMPDRTLIQYRAGLLDKESSDMLEAHLLLCRHASFSWRTCCLQPRLAGFCNCVGDISPKPPDAPGTVVRRNVQASSKHLAFGFAPACTLLAVRAAAAAVLALCLSACAPGGLGPLNRIDRVIGMPPAQLREGHAVHLHAVVVLSKTAGDPMLFVSDGTGAIEIDPRFVRSGLAFGDLVDIDGITGCSGRLAPLVLNPSIRRLGRAPIPTPQPLTARELILSAGEHRHQWARVTGKVLSTDSEAGLGW